jgi:dihydroorotate dehydrogenase electron transfer subunit
VTTAAAGATARAQRDTVFLEQAELMSVAQFSGEQFVFRLDAPLCAENARAGSFVHIRCDDAIPMRRPLSIMRVDRAAGWIELLFKIVGEGLAALSRHQPGAVLSVLGPIGRGFSPDPDRPRSLLLGGGVGIPPMIFLAEQLRREWPQHEPLVLMGSELPFPFDLQVSSLAAPWLANDVNASLALLEEQNISCRLASLQGYDGCATGFVTDLARTFLASQATALLEEVELFACGPTPMLDAAAALAREFNLPCQVSLEEFMACAIGGCAGCTVPVRTEHGVAMRRVCVDGPVFAAADVFPIV